MRMGLLPLDDQLGGAALRLSLGAQDGMPRAQLPDGSRPFQLLTRWYGFALTYPGCGVFPE